MGSAHLLNMSVGIMCLGIARPPRWDPTPPLSIRRIWNVKARRQEPLSTRAVLSKPACGGDGVSRGQFERKLRQLPPNRTRWKCRAEAPAGAVFDGSVPKGAPDLRQAAGVWTVNQLSDCKCPWCPLWLFMHLSFSINWTPSHHIAWHCIALHHIYFFYAIEKRASDGGVFRTKVFCTLLHSIIYN